MEGDPAAAVERASMLLDVGRSDEAIASLTAVLATDPGHVRALCLMSLAQLRRERYGQALQAAHAATAANPDSEWGYRLASLAHRGLNDTPSAISAARAAVRLAPNTAAAHIVLAGALAGSKRDLAEASAEADRAVALAPHEPEAHVVAGRVAYARGDKARARVCLERALALDPDSTNARNELARLDIGRTWRGPSGLARAAHGFAGSLSVDPQFAVGRRNLETVLRIFISRTAYFVFLIAYAAYLVSGSTTATTVRLLPVLGLIVPVAYASRFVLRLSAPLRQTLLSVIRDSWVAPAAVCVAAAGLSIVAGSAAPALTHVAFGVAAILAAAARFILFGDRKRRRQS